MRKLLRSYRFWVFVLLIAGVAAWALWPEREYPFTVSPDTTYLTGPLNPDGTVDYVAALNDRFGKGVTPENNAAPLLLRAWGAEIIPLEVRDKVFDILQMEPVPLKGLAGRRLKDIVEDIWPKGAPKGATTRPTWEDVAKESERVLNRAMAGPWSADELPAVAAWLKENEKQLALVGEAAKRPKFYTPLVTTGDSARMIDVRVVVLWPFRSTGRMYVVRAMNKLHHGNADGAVGDLLAAHRLARLLGQGSSLIDKLMALDLEETICGGDVALATSGKLNAAEQRNFLAELEALPKVASPLETVLDDRLLVLDVVAMCRRRGTGRTFELLEMNWSPPGNIEWNRELRQINAWFNRYEEALFKPNYADSLAAFSALRSDHRKLRARIEPDWDLARMIWRIRRKLPMGRTGGAAPLRRVQGNLAEVLVALVLPAKFWRDNQEQCIMRLEITKLALALGTYRKEKGSFPAALSALKPDYLKRIPQDTFAGKPLIYKRIGKGYLLYSLGLNMKDDGGLEDEATGKDDIAVRVK